MPTFETVARADEIAPGTAKQVTVNGEPVAVINVDGEFYAISDLCTHEEYFLSAGTIEGEEIECFMHAAVFNIKTGDVVSPPAEKPVATYSVRVVDGKVEVSREPIIREKPKVRETAPAGTGFMGRLRRAVRAATER
jgi:3-phenylpropionate/trans-cinnamate dioxygenase ferredoxin subunit